METAGKVFVGLGVGCLVFIILGVVGLMTCTMCTGAAISQGMAENEQEDAEQLALAKSRLPWLATVEATCQRYDLAPNDIQKSAVFQENQQFVQGRQLANVQGELAAASTGHGGGGLLLTARVGRAEFTEAFVAEGDPLYAQAANLVIGQCINFSGQVNNTAMGGGSLFGSMEKSRICGMHYTFEFASITACPQ